MYRLFFPLAVEHGLCGDGKKFLPELFSKGATERPLPLLKSLLFSSCKKKSRPAGRPPLERIKEK